MPNIFDATARVEETGRGIRFYEQDILPCSYLFHGDLVIDIRVDYLFSGFGVVLAEDNARPFTEADRAYLLKIGSNDFQSFTKHMTEVRGMPASACVLTPSQDGRNIHMVFRLEKCSMTLDWVDDAAGKKAVYTLGSAKLPGECEAYRIGFYSNAGNILRHVTFRQNVPENWTVNIGNTCGGRVHFTKDTAYIENCQHDAELEQDGIPLQRGTYYLRYEHGPVNGIDDIECVLFSSEAPRMEREMEDGNKNLLEPDGSFRITGAVPSVNLKFKGTNGWIGDVCIVEDRKSSFVETGGMPVRMHGSYITVQLKNLREVRWTGTITTVPLYMDYAKPCPYAILEFGSHRLTLEQCGILLGHEHRFVFRPQEKTLTITDEALPDAAITVPVPLAKEDACVHIFRNMTAEIHHFETVDMAGEKLDIIGQKTFKKYVPADIRGPIIVTAGDEPLDLSASYREVSENTTRLVSYPTAMPIRLKDDMPYSFADFRIYGIDNDARIQPGASSIEEYATGYAELESQDYRIDSRAIHVSDRVRAIYKHIAVVYRSVDDFHYVFTNWEREVFANPSQRILLEKDVMDNDGDILVYGIRRDASISPERLYRIPQEGMVNAIDLYADRYDIIPSSEYEVLYTGNEIKLNDRVKNEYQQIVVDYLKENSYCINYREDIGEYEVDIASNASRILVNYNGREDGSSYDYKRTDFRADTSQYIVLRRDMP